MFVASLRIATAHDFVGEWPTYSVTAPGVYAGADRQIRLQIIDGETGKPLPARFTVILDGTEYVPPSLGVNGLRFTSIHRGGHIAYPVLYARGTGPVAVPLPASAKLGRIFVAHGYEYLPVETRFSVEGPIAEVRVTLNRWTVPTVKENYPPTADVFREAHELGGVVGHAHGGTMGTEETSELDAVLGVTDFMEIANPFLTERDIWHELMNCGIDLPPAAGTDLPNFPNRNWWQPFLGEVRMYLRTGDDNNFGGWVKALRRREVFVSSGPVIDFRVNDLGPGGEVRLPKGGGDVGITAGLTFYRQLEDLQIIRNGQPVATTTQREKRDGIEYLRIHQRVRIDQSCWFAAYGTGEVTDLLKTPIAPELLKTKLGSVYSKMKDIRVFAHTAAVRVLVDNQPIRVAEDVLHLKKHFEEQREFYQTKAVLNSDQRKRFDSLYEHAIASLTAGDNAGLKAER